MNYNLYLLKKKVIPRLEDFIIKIFAPLRWYYKLPSTVKRNKLKKTKKDINRLKEDIFYYIEDYGKCIITDIWDSEREFLNDINTWNYFDIEILISTLKDKKFFSKNKFTIKEMLYVDYVKDMESFRVGYEDIARVRDKKVWIIEKVGE